MNVSDGDFGMMDDSSSCVTVSRISSSTFNSDCIVASELNL